MINYELAKRLKDAGFPNDWESRCGHCGYDNGSNFPTLSELIDACGDSSFSLNGYNRNKNAPYEEYWKAGTWHPTIDQQWVLGEGKTPEEAVANLWLSFNKKD